LAATARQAYRAKDLMEAISVSVPRPNARASHSAAQVMEGPTRESAFSVRGGGGRKTVARRS
jgi:hypothetical protein